MLFHHGSVCPAKPSAAIDLSIDLPIYLSIYPSINLSTLVYTIMPSNLLTYGPQNQAKKLFAAEALGLI